MKCQPEQTPSVLLENKCEGVRLTPMNAEEIHEFAQHERILVGPFREQDNSINHTRYFALRNGCLQGCIGIKRAAYENGVEIPYDNRENYVNKIDFLAVYDEASMEMISALIARAILEVGGRKLFLADTENDEMAGVFCKLGFRQISGLGWGKKRFGYLLHFKQNETQEEKPHTALSKSALESMLTEQEAVYHSSLKSNANFDIIQLAKDNWTIYKRYGNEFIFVLTHGTIKRGGYSGFKIDMYDMKNGALVGYIDIFVPELCDYALNDIAITDFLSEPPASLNKLLDGFPDLDIERAHEIRNGWQQREGLWVRVDYRRAGIGGSLMRIAGDVCKLTYPRIKRIGINFSNNNINACQFHAKLGANVAYDGPHAHEYELDSTRRPRISILYGM